MRRRMLISASLVLLLFMILTAVILDQAFKGSLRTDLQDRLQTQLYLVLGAAEFEQQRLLLPPTLNFPKLNQLESGSLALIINAEGNEVWRSGSAQSFGENLVPGQKLIQGPAEQGGGELNLVGEKYFYASLGVAWEIGAASSEQLQSYTLIVAEHSVRFENNISQYRMYLWLGLALLATILLAVFTWTLYWGLSPLKQLEHDLNLIETGKAEQLSGEYPKELAGVAQNLNQLLQHEKRQHNRYRNTLSNLAHSLKTPLAVLRGLVDNHYLVNDPQQVNDRSVGNSAESPSQSRLSQVSPSQIRTLDEQVGRMDEIVQHQLQRAAHVGPQSLQQTIEVLPLLESLANVVEKVYQDSLQCIDLDTEAGVLFKGAKGDLMELVGNLLDNAAKYGGGLIRLVLTNEQENDQLRCRILVEDNGPGIAEEDVADILRRGVRADQKQQGQGIGLAMVVDIVDQYQGKLHLGTSALGGLKVEISL